MSIQKITLLQRGENAADIDDIATSVSKLPSSLLERSSMATAAPGMPTRFISDRDPRFDSAFWKEFFDQC